MKKAILTSALLCIGGAAMAQGTISFTNVVDTTAALTASVFAGDYSPSEDKYLVSEGGLALRVINNAGTLEATAKDITGTTPSGLGFFAIAIGTDGSIFAFEDTGDDLWQWDNIADNTVTKAHDTALFARTGQVLGTGNSTKVFLTGSANAGPVEIFTTTDDITYTVASGDTVAANAKSSLAVNAAGTALWAVPDSNQPINKTVNTGTWVAETTTWLPGTTGAGASILAYDDANNVVFAVVGTALHAIDGTTGTALTGSPFTLTNAMNATPGYGGSHVTSSAGNGTLWFVGRGTTASNASVHKLTYTITGASESNWSMY